MKKQISEVRLPVSSKEAGKKIVEDFKAIVGSGSLQEVDFEVHGTETESMSGHKSTDWEIVIKRKDKTS